MFMSLFVKNGYHQRVFREKMRTTVIKLYIWQRAACPLRGGHNDVPSRGVTQCITYVDLTGQQVSRARIRRRPTDALEMAG